MLRILTCCGPLPSRPWSSTTWSSDFPGRNETLYGIVRAGQYGVDLFFVLSGYLIGGLYWRELAARGTIDGSRFIARRATRTMPPYFVAMAIAFCAVWWTRHQVFDAAFLVFGQNYRSTIPFFLVSWSLCVEEHFYVALPLFLAVFRRRAARLIPVALTTLAILPTAFRSAVADRAIGLENFGYFHTATHLRFEGLVLGVLASYLAQPGRLRIRVGPVLRVATWGVAMTLWLGLPWIDPRVAYVGGYLGLALAFTALVLVVAHDVPYRASLWRATKVAAVSSYSVYLTHAWVLFAALSVAERWVGPRYPVTIALTLSVVVAAVGYVFYATIERGTLRVRERLVPDRARGALIPVIHGPRETAEIGCSLPGEPGSPSMMASAARRRGVADPVSP